ncbi:LysM peptidoglycan-binding domain-containing protein [Romboutsia sp. 1001285H_161024_C4]|uniref:LysM peptidoglycan-binding domain-containing protein n=1 Tax=Romboutsia sp. 1001285H_161024_C4 TaxID=2787109 RepID=UPI001896CF09|nr:LysM peptidoglycan-binding domain-containing protein [Romboutsia sp. 1001285H_161024_C4]
MEIWLRNDRLKFQLPVNPPNFALEGNAKINGEGIVRYGDISIYGGRGLRKIEISSIFPNHEYTFVEYKNFPKPYECVDNINSWFRRGSPILFTITGTNINMNMTITDFTYGEQDGTGDVYYSINLIEYVDTQVNQSSSNNNSNKRPNENTGSSSNKQKVHKVVKGDNLWDIAHKYYGKGSDYPKIKNANKEKYPSLKKNNIIYVNWELIIP